MFAFFESKEKKFYFKYDFALVLPGRQTICCMKIILRKYNIYFLNQVPHHTTVLGPPEIYPPDIYPLPSTPQDIYPLGHLPPRTFTPLGLLPPRTSTSSIFKQGSNVLNCIPSRWKYITSWI